MTEELPPLDRAALSVLAGFAATLSDPGFDAGGIVQPPVGEDGVFVMPGAMLSDEAEVFVEAMYEAGWVRPFDWSAWGHSSDGQRYFADLTAVAGATIEDLSHLLTAIIRQDRFVTGALLESFKSGMVAAIANRAQTLLGDNGGL